jgi:hypothetical protein
LLKRQLDIIPAIGKFSQGCPRPDAEKRSQEMSGAKTGQAGQCERPRGAERGSRLLKDKTMPPAESVKMYY